MSLRNPKPIKSNNNEEKEDKQHIEVLNPYDDEPTRSFISKEHYTKAQNELRASHYSSLKSKYEFYRNAYEKLLVEHNELKKKHEVLLKNANQSHV